MLESSTTQTSGDIELPLAAMDPATQALCFFYRNPPSDSGVRPQPFRKIPKLIRRPSMNIERIKSAVRRFCLKKKKRGRRVGWRKTSQKENQAILACFHKVRQPLGSLVEATDVWKALPAKLRRKICTRTVSNRLKAEGYKMEEKLSGDDKGEAWRKTRVRFCKTHHKKTGVQWVKCVQGVADFRYFTFYPPGMKSRHARKSAPRTIMKKSEKKKAAFLKPRSKMFRRSEHKRALKAKVFGLTTSTSLQLICHVKARFTSHDLVTLVRQRVGRS